VIEKQKERAAKYDDESDMSEWRCYYFSESQPLPSFIFYAVPPPQYPTTMSPYCLCAVDAYVACGGAADKSGHVERETLVKIIKEDFGLTIDIEKLIDDIDEDGSGEIEYGEFRQLLS
jgi:hypothetical protein